MIFQGSFANIKKSVRAKFAKPRRLLVQSRTPQKSFVFLLEEKIWRAQIKKCEQNFSVVWRALASGGGAGQFRSKWVRAKFRIEHQVRKVKEFRFASLRSATNLYSILGTKTNWRFRILGEESFLILNTTKL